ncbi:MAG: methionine biosynthesis protein MetW, partial [Thermoguttaceae bacterium]|nr:methionine biosynthesis protein MetW [Thermoguttaceae bacterium]
ETKFSVGSYLAHQGNKFVERFDANSYLTLSMVIDTFDLGETQEERIQLLRKSMCRWLIISFSSDWLFPPFQAQEIVRTLIAVDKRVSYCNIESDCGHDAFLLENNLPLYGGLIQAFLKNGYEEHVARAQFEPMGGLSGNQRAPAHLHGTKHRIDYDGIIDLIPPQAKILDLGCGKGDLLYQLKQRGHSHLVGMEIEEQLILKCVHRGLDVLHSDINKGLKDFADKQFDFVILSKTLQTVRNVELILEEMLRVGTRVIVSFPNLGYYRFRAELNESGRAPRIDPRPGRLWYNTNDVRFLTLTDFEQFCHEKGYRIHRQIAFDTELDAVVESNPNLNADVAIVVLSRE